MFDIGLGEIMLTFGVGIAIIGRRDLPVFARAAGRQLGRAVTYVKKSKDSFGNKLDEKVGHNELKQVQAELNKTMRELDAVKREIYSASNISTSTFLNSQNNNNMQQQQQQQPISQEISSSVTSNSSNNVENIMTNNTKSSYNNNNNGTRSSDNKNGSDTVTGSNLLTEIYLDEWEYKQNGKK